MIHFQPIGGTNDAFGRPEDEPRWWREDSPFSFWMHRQGYMHMRPDFPFWSTALDGWWGSGHRTWKFGAQNLAGFLATLPYEHRNVISLSHGGNVTAIALANYDLEVASWISVTTPVRKDMQEVYETAIPKVGTFTHVYAKGWRDRFQLLGSLMDGTLRYKRTINVASSDVLNIGIPEIGHSSLVRDPDVFGMWNIYDLLERLGHVEDRDDAERVD